MNTIESGGEAAIIKEILKGTERAVEVSQETLVRFSDSLEHFSLSEPMKTALLVPVFALLLIWLEVAVKVVRSGPGPIEAFRLNGFRPTDILKGRVKLDDFS